MRMMFLFCVLMSLLSSAIVMADHGGQGDCRRCHAVLPATHVPVADDGIACLQCHAGHSIDRSAGKSLKEPVCTDRMLRWNGATVDGIGFMVLLVGIIGPVLHGTLFLASSSLRKSRNSSATTYKSRSRPGLLRGWHVINAATVVFLSMTGFGLHWGLAGGPGSMVAWHSIAGGWHVLTWTLWLGFNVVTACYVGRYPRPAGGWFAGIARQTLYYSSGIFLGRPHPHPREGFNPLQSVVYLLVMVLLLPLVMVSGIGLLSLRSVAFGNIERWAHLLVQTHFLAGCLLLGFLSVHLYLAIWGPEGRLWRR